MRSVGVRGARAQCCTLSAVPGTESYQGFELDYESQFDPSRRAGTCWVRVRERGGEDPLFEVEFAVTLPFCRRRNLGEDPEAVCSGSELLAIRWTHGLIDLQQWEMGGHYSQERTTSWVPQAAALTEDEIESRLLDVFAQMVEIAPLVGYAPRLDVDGVADVFGLPSDSVVKRLATMERRGWIEPYAYEKKIAFGQARITAAGLAARETMHSSGWQTAAIVFTDIVGSTQLSNRWPEPERLNILKRHDETARETARKHNGTVVKSLGDGVMARFPSAKDSVEFAAEVRGVPGRDPTGAAIPIRIGIHVGDLRATPAGDVEGMSIVVAQRLCSNAEAGEVLVSEAIRQAVLGHPFPWRDKGQQILKGITEPMQSWALDLAKTLPPDR